MNIYDTYMINRHISSIIPTKLSDCPGPGEDVLYFQVAIGDHGSPPRFLRYDIRTQQGPCYVFSFEAPGVRKYLDKKALKWCQGIEPDIALVTCCDFDFDHNATFMTCVFC